MTSFARRIPRSRRRSKHDSFETLENSSAPSLNLQMLRENPERLGRDQILHLQRTVGNSTTQQLLRGGTMSPGLHIQRMPTAQVVENTLGKPKKDTKFFGKITPQSTKYKAVLAALKAFETFTISTYLADTPSELRAQMTDVNRLLQTIYDKMNTYQGKKGKKAVFMMAHLAEVKTFQNLAARAFLNKMDNPGSGHKFLRASLNGFLNKALRDGGQPPIRLNSKDQVGSERGGSKSVDKFDMGNDTKGYFSDQKNTINNVNPDSRDEKEKQQYQAIFDDIRVQTEAEGEQKGWTKKETEGIIDKRRNAKRNEYTIGMGYLGIDPDDARMNNRDIAMSRLDQLLNTHLIARAQFAVVHMPDGSTREGSLMAGAKGKSPNDFIEDANEKGGSSKQEIIDNRVGAIGLEDPEIMRQLSRLQLLDIIAYQVDRNIGNYFVHRDENGKLIGITGIDNDFSFGTNTDPDRKRQAMPGISRYVDKELAQVIIALDPSLLEPILSDLLPQREIEAAITRLVNLQAELQSNLTNLLEPDEWIAHAKDIVDEDKSYYSELNYQMRKQLNVKF